MLILLLERVMTHEILRYPLSTIRYGRMVHLNYAYETKYKLR
jgi:hypothetical protein